MDPRYYKRVQIVNILTPAVGFCLSLPAWGFLIFHAARNGNTWHAVSCTIYGATLVVSYALFTLYHVFKYHERWGTLCKILDHSAVYLLIAGTYTPFLLTNLRGSWGWTLFGVVWGLTIFGVVFKIFFIHRFKILAPLIYLFMGWLLIFAIKPAVMLIPLGGLQLLLAGGLFYSFGLLFYAWKRFIYHHAIWHLFVLAGSICHYLAVFYHVIPPSRFSVPL
jgi:hemolysin III